MFHINIFTPNSFRQETDELKKQLHGVRIQKASLEEQIRNVQQEMTRYFKLVIYFYNRKVQFVIIDRWRFEALKTRCVLLNREDLLTEKAIEFKPIRAIEFNISQKEQETARPRILHPSPGTPQYNSPKEKKTQVLDPQLGAIQDGNTLVVYNTPSKNISVKQELDYQSDYNTLGSLNSNEFKENIGTPQRQQESNISVKTELSSDKHLRNFHSNSLANELDMAPLKNYKREPPGLDAQPGPSILSKKGDAFVTEENWEKNVQFSAQGPTVHDISANVSMGSEATNDSMNKEGKHKPFIKEVRKKPSVIVRHVVVPSKRKPT